MKRAKEAGSPFSLVLLDAHMPVMDGFALAERIKQDPGLAGATIMMLSSAGERGDAARCLQLGIVAYFTKPVRQPDLLRAIRVAVGEEHGADRPPRLVTRHSLREARRKLCILLAEDNVVNQQLVIRFLEKRGHSVVLAANGQEPLEFLESHGLGAFDAVLMDAQMPEMDGLEATATIRKREKATGTHLPIIAMTAHALKGDRERCLAAGMDGYLSKPIKSLELLEVVEGVAPSLPDEEKGLAGERRANQVFDRAAALARVGNDEKLLEEVVRLFFGEAARLLSAMREAVTCRDAQRLKRAAHTLKGSVANFGAQQVHESAL